MALPYCVSCALPASRLYERADGKFQIVERLPLAPFMSGYQYLIVEARLARFLASLGLSSVRVSTAAIFDPRTNTEDTSWFRVRVSETFAMDQIECLTLDGPRMWSFGDESYFVSPMLKQLLEENSFRYLQFSEGLSDFADNTA